LRSSVSLIPASLAGGPAARLGQTRQRPYGRQDRTGEARTSAAAPSATVTCDPRLDTVLAAQSLRNAGLRGLNPLRCRGGGSEHFALHPAPGPARARAATRPEWPPPG